ncbi:MAG: acetylornithine aminotransferase [Elusimicrobia bacterium RIFOXYA2_FULL_58_8]|nr:MAG: acetylornithine aminotransferase [Elusimicrobia bacterium RIFOXYA2_FULL_58_8]
MNLSAIQKAEKKYLLQTYDRYPAAFTRGKGMYLYDEKGRAYLDFLSGIGVMALGYAHPDITRAIRKQAGLLVHVSNLFYTPFQSALARELTRLSGLDRAFFSNSGAEAWEAALKLARAYAGAAGKKKRIHFLAMENSFHGRTMGAVATTSTAKYRAPFAPVMPGVTFVKFNDTADLRRKFNAAVCAVCLETVQGEGGIRPVSREFFAEARRLTRRSNALLLADEIQCGLGRTGKMFAYQHYGIKPDVITLAKPIACGLPLGAMLATEKAAAAFKPGMHGTTYGGGPLACAAALEFLAVMRRKNTLAHIKSSGAYLMGELRALAARHPVITEVRGMGLMAALELSCPDTAKAVQQRLLARRIIINRTHETVLRFLPPYIVTRGQLDQLAAALHQALAACAPAGKKPHARP